MDRATFCRVLMHPSVPTPPACFPAALHVSSAHETLRFPVSVHGICLFVSSLFRHTVLSTSAKESFLVIAHVLLV